MGSNVTNSWTTFKNCHLPTKMMQFKAINLRQDYVYGNKPIMLKHLTINVRQVIAEIPAECTKTISKASQETRNQVIKISLFSTLS